MPPSQHCDLTMRDLSPENREGVSLSRGRNKEMYPWVRWASPDDLLVTRGETAGWELSYKAVTRTIRKTKPSPPKNKDDRGSALSRFILQAATYNGKTYIVPGNILVAAFHAQIGRGKMVLPPDLVQISKRQVAALRAPEVEDNTTGEDVHDDDVGDTKPRPVQRRLPALYDWDGVYADMVEASPEDDMYADSPEASSLPAIPAVIPCHLTMTAVQWDELHADMADASSASEIFTRHMGQGRARGKEQGREEGGKAEQQTWKKENVKGREIGASEVGEAVVMRQR